MHVATADPRPEPSEANPLLGSTGAADRGYGSSTTISTVPASEQQIANGNGAGEENGSEEAGAAPASQLKLHLLLPALAVGIFLSALDQTLIVATYARISSDLQALNRTSWISTA